LKSLLQFLAFSKSWKESHNREEKTIAASVSCRHQGSYWPRHV